MSQMSKHSIVLFGYFYFELILIVYSFDYPVKDPSKPNHIYDQRPPGWVDPFDMGLRSSDTHDQRPPGWVDPFDMGLRSSDFTSDGHYGWKDFARPSESKYTNSRPTSDSYSEKFIIYQRFINVFLRALELKDSPDIIGSKLVHLDLEIYGNDLKELKEFGNNGSKDVSVEKVSEILNKIFRQSEIRSTSYESSISKMIEWVRQAVVKLMNSPEWIITVFITGLLGTVLWLVFVTHSYRIALFTAFFLIFITGYGFTWMRMYEEKEVERFYNELRHGDAPYHCKGNTLKWYETVYYYWFGEDCLKFYQTRDVRPIVKVTPLEVLSVTLSTMIIEPCQNIGKAYGSFITGILGHTPWYFLPFALVIAFIPPVFTFFFLALLFGYQFKFSLFSISLLPSWSNSLSHRRDDKYLEELSRRTDLNSQNKSELTSLLSNDRVMMSVTAMKELFSISSNENLGENVCECDAALNRANTEKERAVMELKEEVTNIQCKKRIKSIYTCRGGGSSTNEFEHSDNALNISAGGDRGQTDNEKDIQLNRSKTS